MKLWKYPTFEEEHARSLVKSTIWRAGSILFLALVTYIFTHNWFITAAVTVTENLVFIAVYYLHERLWLRLPWFRGSAYKPFAKMFTYEIVLGNLILGLIAYIFTQDLPQTTALTLTYTCNKLWMYYAYDYVWSKIGWQTKQ